MLATVATEWFGSSPMLDVGHLGVVEWNAQGPPMVVRADTSKITRPLDTDSGLI